MYEPISFSFWSWYWFCLYTFSHPPPKYFHPPPPPLARQLWQNIPLITLFNCKTEKHFSSTVYHCYSLLFLLFPQTIPALLCVLSFILLDAVWFFGKFQPTKILHTSTKSAINLLVSIFVSPTWAIYGLYFSNTASFSMLSSAYRPTRSSTAISLMRSLIRLQMW